jgi:hypothetical protein
VVIGLLLAVSPPSEEDAWAFPLYALIAVTWSLTGAFLVTRRPDNRVGWVLLAVGLGIGASIAAQAWIGLSYSSHDGSLPGIHLAAALGVAFTPSLYLVMLVPLLFPDGRVMSGRWAAAAGLLVAAAVMTFVGSLVRPGPLEGGPNVENPFGIAGFGAIAQVLIDLGGLSSLACLPAGIAAAILRYRRGSRVERKQLQWFGSVLVFAFSMFFAAATLPQPIGQWAWILAGLSLGLIPIAIGLAILRYRLYDIDRIISRTIGWSLVTGALLAAFTAAVLVFQAALAGITQGQTLAVAGSTLLAFAMFQPLRRRIQSIVDRRFDRARYDAEQTLLVFTDRLRDQLDLEALGQEVGRVAAETVRPESAGLWLRNVSDGSNRVGSVTVSERSGARMLP